jgi:hypothetical protein
MINRRVARWLARAAAMKSVRRNTLLRMRRLFCQFARSGAPHWVQPEASGQLAAPHSGQCLLCEDDILLL